MENLMLDLRYALRTLRRSPLFTALAVLILALGIGVNTGGFSFVQAFLLRPLPFADPGRLVHLWETDHRLGSDRGRVSLPTFRDWREQNERFADMGVFNYSEANLTGVGSQLADEVPERISVGRISANVFDLLGVDPLRGRGFLPGEDQPGQEPVAVISHRFWEQRFGGDETVLGRIVRFDDTAYTVVGVMPPEFLFPLPITEVWLPRIMDANRYQRDDRFLQVVGRLKPGVSQAEAQAEMAAIAQRLEQEYPELMAQRGVRVVPLREALNFASEIIQPMSVVMLLTNGFVLLIVCANLANLLLSRSVTRGHELSIRMALGARRRRLVRQQLTESLLLALAGGGLGLLVAAWNNRWLEGLVPADIYRVGRFDIDLGAVGFTFAVSLLTAVLCGGMPALRTSGVNVVSGLKQRGGLGRASQRVHSLLVVAQMSLALVLLVGCALTVRTFSAMRRVDPGFDADRILTMKLVLPSTKYADAEQVVAFHRDVVAGVAAVPGVEVAATVDLLPLNHETSNRGFEIVGQPASADEVPWASAQRITPNYFATMGMELRQGRAFDRRDDADAPPVVIINQTMAQKYWPRGNALGARLRLSDVEREIVGVVADTRHQRLDDQGLAQIYLPQSQEPGRYLRLLVRTQSEPTQLAGAVRQAVWAVDSRLPITEVRTMAVVVEEFLGPQWAMAVLMGIVGAGAMVLACLGIYGVMAFYVGQRRREIAVHMALGARREVVGRLILWRGMKLALAGVVPGLVVAAVMARLMKSLLFQAAASTAVPFVAVPLLLALVAAVACLIPARRAAAVDPMTVLRYE